MLSIKKNYHIVSTLFFLLFLASTAACGYLVYRYISYSRSQWMSAENEAIHKTKQASKDLINYVEVLKPIATSIAQKLSDKEEITEDEIVAVLNDEKVDEIFGAGVAFLPHAFKKNTRLFGRAIVEKDGKEVIRKIEDTCNYTDQKCQWFYQPIKNGAGFIKPYYDKELGATVAQYGAPIYRTDAKGKQTVIGMAFANQSLRHLQNIIETLFLGNTGYWFILTEEGTFLSYPQITYKNKTIFDIANDIANPGLAEAAKKIMQGESVRYEYNNEITGASSWLISERIGSTPWSIVGVFDQNEFFHNPNTSRHHLMLPSIAFLVAIILFGMFLATIFEKNIYLWTILSAIISAAMFIQIIWIWYAIYNHPKKEPEPDIYRIESQKKLFEYLEKNFDPQATTPPEEYKDLTLDERLLKIVPYKQLIPTGVYINNLQFAEASEIKLSAYFWQRFSPGLHDNLPPGFVFIQTNDANIVPETTMMQGKEKLLTFDVFAKFNLFLTYSLYPFDMKSVRIKYWTKTSNENFYFIPDLNSYQLINPRSLPGIDPDVFVPGWTIVGSYFGYQKLPYTTNFGSYNIGNFGVYEELDISSEPQSFFEIVMRRNLYDALVSDLIPIAVIAVLLFLVLLMSGPGSDKYLTAIASIFFATIFAQIRFRSKIPQAQIVYLESLYFILYSIMLVLLVACFLVQYNIKVTYITSDNNIKIKLLYWPLLFGSFVVVSFIYLW